MHAHICIYIYIAMHIGVRTKGVSWQGDKHCSCELQVLLQQTTCGRTMASAALVQSDCLFTMMLPAVGCPARDRYSAAPLDGFMTSESFFLFFLSETSHRKSKESR